MSRGYSSIKGKIQGLLTEGRLLKSPNYKDKRNFTDDQVEYIIMRRNELSVQGESDQSISRKIAKETGRSPHTIENKIRKLRREKKLRKNPNKREIRRFTNRDIILLVKRRTELIISGLTDYAIASKLSDEMERSKGSILTKISCLVKTGKLTGNPNKQESTDFTDQEISTILNMRTELIAEGLTDFRISRKIAKKLERSQGSIKEKICRLIKSEILPPNPNRYRQNPARTDLLSGLTQAADAMEKFGDIQ
jgi:hypothetical protein